MTVANPSMPGLPLSRPATGPFPPVWARHTRIADAGTEVAPGDQETVGVSRSSWRWQFLTDLNPRPERLKSVCSVHWRTLRPERLVLRDAVNRKPVPVEGRCGIALIEAAHHTIQACEGRSVVDPRPGPSRRRHPYYGGSEHDGYEHLSLKNREMLNAKCYADAESYRKPEQSRHGVGPLDSSMTARQYCRRNPYR